ncbi:MAG: T9SS type A sorting domain-containing protein [Ignavibacteriaceae bacterium]
MKKFALFLFFLFGTSLLAQVTGWDVAWKMEQLPFMDPQIGSELAIVKAGFDTDQDGWGEFLCAWTDLEHNYLLMYEASGDNQYDLVWHFEYPVDANTFAGIAVGDIDNNGLVDIITTMPSVANDLDWNPPRLWDFEWNGVVGENKYGFYIDTVMSPTSTWHFGVKDSVDFRPYSLQIEDIDKDGQNELIVGVRQGYKGREVIVASVDGELNGFGSWQTEYDFAQPFGGSLYSVTTGDLDNDGLNEIYALIWNYFTMRIFEYDGTSNYNITTQLDEINTVDFGSVDGVRVADVNDDGVMEMYIAGTEPQNNLFIITNISDVSQITADDVKVLFTIPSINVGKLRTMQIADPDHDGNLSLMIAGEGNGQIYDVEYKGTGDPADSSSWDIKIIFDVWDYSGISPNDSPTITPRFFYGSPASDMDKDGKDEYLFVNYSTDFNVWSNDIYLWVIENQNTVDVNEEVSNILPEKFSLGQNYPNPFNPSTKINFSVPEKSNVIINVYNALGEEVKELVNKEFEAGVHNLEFNASDLTSGVYFYKLQAGSFVQTKKMILLK